MKKAPSSLRKFSKVFILIRKVCASMKTMRMLVLWVLLYFVWSSMAEIELYEFSSREEMVQMAGYGEEKLSTVLVTGSVLCEACHHLPHAQPRTWPISGAVVAVKCQTAACKSKSAEAMTVTDEYGDFVIDLPSHLHGVPNLHKICRVKVVGIPKNSMCRPRPAFFKKHKGLIFSSVGVGNGIRTYTAGRIRFQHITSKSLKECFPIGRAGTGSDKQRVA